MAYPMAQTPMFRIFWLLSARGRRRRGVRGRRRVGYEQKAAV